MAEQPAGGSKLTEKKLPKKLVGTISILNWEPKFEDVIDGLTAAPYSDADSRRQNNPGRKHTG